MKSKKTTQKKTHPGLWEPFHQMRRRNKVLFSILVAASLVLFWKGSWNLIDILFDEWFFRGHLFWSNLTAVLVGIAVMGGAGVLLQKLG